MPTHFRLSFITYTSILLHSPHSQRPLLVTEPFPLGCSREVRQNQYRTQRDEDSQGPFDVEQPPPGGMAELALHAAEDARSHEGSEGVADNIAAVEDGNTEPEFGPFVPFAEKEVRPREEGGFDEAEEEAGKEGSDEAAWVSVVVGISGKT